MLQEFHEKYHIGQPLKFIKDELSIRGSFKEIEYFVNSHVPELDTDDVEFIKHIRNIQNQSHNYFVKFKNNIRNQSETTKSNDIQNQFQKQSMKEKIDLR